MRLVHASILPGANTYRPACLSIPCFSTNRKKSATRVFQDFTREGDPEVLRIDWDFTQENHAYLMLENSDDAGEDVGDRLTFQSTGANRSMDFVDVSSGLVWFIEWNEVNHSGSLMVPNYNDGNRACWDNNLVNVECPSES